ncbi:hypothetical protein [Kaarinaea lacus]
MHARKLLVAAFLFIPSIYAFADEKPVKVNGFITAAFNQGKNDTDTPYLYGLATDELSLDTYENRFGLQIAATLTEDMDVTAQLISRGGTYNYNVDVDFAYIDYHPFKNFNAHIGKYKIPLFLVSDYADVGFAYPWVRPPQDVYSINPLLSQTGLQLLYNIPISSVNLMLQAYYGEGTHDVFAPSSSIDAKNSTLESGEAPFEKDALYELRTKNAGGLNISLSSKIFTLRLGYFDTKVDAPAFLIEDASGDFSSASFMLDWRNIVIYSEYANRDTDSDKIKAFPDQEAWYATLGYRIKSFLPYATYSDLDEGNDPNPLSLKQSSTALGLRYEVNPSAAIKFEALQSKPKDNNHGLFYQPVDEGMIYTLTMDAIF